MLLPTVIQRPEIQVYMQHMGQRARLFVKHEVLINVANKKLRNFAPTT